MRLISGYPATRRLFSDFLTSARFAVLCARYNGGSAQQQLALFLVECNIVCERQACTRRPTLATTTGRWQCSSRVGGAGVAGLLRRFTAYLETCRLRANQPLLWDLFEVRRFQNLSLQSAVVAFAGCLTAASHVTQDVPSIPVL